MTCNGCLSCVDQPPVREFTAPGLFVKQMYVRTAGTLVPQHAHQLGHLTMIARGSFRVWRDGLLAGDYIAPDGLFIEAGVKHTFMSLEDESVAYCVHNTMSTGKVDIMEEHQFDGMIPDYVRG